MATRKEIICSNKFNPADLPFMFDISRNTAKSLCRQVDLVQDKKTKEDYIRGEDMFRLIMSRREEEKWDWIGRIMLWIDKPERFFYVYRNQRHVDSRFPIDLKKDEIEKGGETRCQAQV